MRTLVSLLLLGLGAAAQEARILHQRLDLSIDPEASGFVCMDAIRVRGPGIVSAPALDGVTATPATHEVGDGEHTVTIRFAGKIRNPVQKSRAATWVAGDRTAGTIGPQGSYLVRGFFVPSKEPCRFRISISVPLPHRAVSSGERLEEREADGRYAVTYETALASDGIVVVTGPWTIKEERIGDTSCRTYLYEQDRLHADLLLSSLREEIPRYTELFGPVPDGRFDVVENFFATGYGFANFTLLGDTVIRYVCAKTAREKKTALPAGYLDHELVHCWLGNHLHVDYEKGNWCEALTTYFTNYGASEREKSDAEYRRKVSRSFSLRVGAQNDYPLRDFKEKRHDYENDIGYGKGSMVFHMLARRLGKGRLARAVRHVVETRGGRKLGWDGLVDGLSEVCAGDLKPWFEPWLSRTGAPVLEFGEMKVDGRTVVGTILQAQEGPPYNLVVPVRIVARGGFDELLVRCSSRETVFRHTVAFEPEDVEIDPEHHVFRRVPRARVAPCLEAVLTAPKRVGFGDKGLLERLEVTPIEPGLPTDAAVLAIGVPDAVRADLLRGARGLSVGDGKFVYRGETYDQPGDSILLSYARADAPGLPVTLFHGNSRQAFARTRYLPYYSAHGWVVFRDGRPLARGNFNGDRAARAAVTSARRKPASSLVRDLLLLTDAVYKGRRAGTQEAYRLANTLRGRLFRAGLKVPAWPPVTIATGRLAGPCTAVALDGDRAHRFKPGFFPFHLSASPQHPPVLDRVVEHPSVEVKGALVLLPEDAPTDLAREYARAGAGAVAVVATDATFAARGREAAWENGLPEGVKVRGDEAIAVSGMMARSRAEPLDIPYVYLHPDAAAALRKPGRRAVLEYSIHRSTLSTSNVIGVLGNPREPGVLLSAHWDGVGGGAPGASDNAAGVAVVLWVAEQLERDHDAGRLKRPVVVALFGGEEMGLCGSRQFAAVLESRHPPLARPLNAVNVDGVGSGGDTVYLIGRSYYSALLPPFQKALAGSGLTLGRDIDRFAYPEGSDHWPLHRAGIPAVSVFSADYRAMNTPRDTLDKVDVAHLRKLARVVYRMVRELAGKK